MECGPTSASYRQRQVTPTSDSLQSLWRTLNIRYFDGALPPIRIEWSRRMTSSAGLFITNHGPRPRHGARPPHFEGRRIRLSVPLLRKPTVQPDGPLLATLAHEMIHQWQFDILKRRANHGPDFCRKMRELNRDGIGITITHRMDDAVRANLKFTWECLRCGRAYRRQRRTIDPARHRCGPCGGRLRELASPVTLPAPASPRKPLPANLRARLTRLNRGLVLSVQAQLSLPFGRPA